MTDIVITRWKKYGKNRGYVARSGGTKLGWVYLLTGAIVLEGTEMPQRFRLRRRSRLGLDQLAGSVGEHVHNSA